MAMRKSTSGTITNRHLIEEIHELERELSIVSSHTEKFDKDLRETKRMMFFLVAIIISLLAFSVGMVAKYVLV